MTRELSRCVTLANHEAKRLSSARLEPEHLLLGFCASEPSLAPALRRSLDVELRSLRLHVEKLTRDHSPGLARDVLPPSPATRRLFINAAGEAGRSGQGQVAPEHVLLAMLRDEQSIAARALARMGVDVDAVRRRLVEAVQNWCSPAAPMAVIEIEPCDSVIPYEPKNLRPFGLSQDSLNGLVAAVVYFGILGLVCLALLRMIIG